MSIETEIMKQNYVCENSGPADIFINKNLNLHVLYIY